MSSSEENGPRDDQGTKNRPGGIYEEFPFGVWMCGPEGELLYASESFLDLLDISTEQASGCGWTDIARESSDSVERWKQCLTTGQDWDDEHQVRDREGELHTLLARGHAIRGDGGGTDRWIGLHLDISGRKQAELRVKDAHDFAQAIVDATPGPLLVLDAQHRVVTANPAFYRQFGSRPDQITHRPLWQISNGQWDVPRLRQFLEQLQSTGDFFDHQEVGCDFADLGRRSILVSGRRIQRRLSDSDLIVLVFDDVTESRRNEERLRIDEQTRAVQRERERLAHRLHDHIQQLLHSASLHVGLVEANVENEEDQQSLKQAEQALKEAAHAARDLAVELTPPVLLESGLVAALRWLVDWVKNKHRLDIELNVDPQIRVEPENLRLLIFEVIRELLLNVAKHAQVASAALQAEQVDERLLKIVVRDHGVGCRLEQLEESDGKAGGFGLTSIRRRIETVGGELDIDTTPGQGTAVAIHLPLLQGV